MSADNLSIGWQLHIISSPIIWEDSRKKERKYFICLVSNIIHLMFLYCKIFLIVQKYWKKGRRLTKVSWYENSPYEYICLPYHCHDRYVLTTHQNVVADSMITTGLTFFTKVQFMNFFKPNFMVKCKLVYYIGSIFHTRVPCTWDGCLVIFFFKSTIYGCLPHKKKIRKTTTKMNY